MKETSDFDRWFAQWRTDIAERHMPLKTICEEAFEAGQIAAITEIVADDATTWHPDCTFRIGASHRCASHLGHRTPHQMVQQPGGTVGREWWFTAR